jgi:hypothetical protein
MENKKMLMGLGVLALAGYLYYRYDKKQKETSIMTPVSKGDEMSKATGSNVTCADGITRFCAGTKRGCCAGIDEQYKKANRRF